jgi:hypothetical protein
MIMHVCCLPHLQAGKPKKQQEGAGAAAQPGKKHKAADSSKPTPVKKAQQVPGAVRASGSSSSSAANGVLSATGAKPSKGTKRGREEVPDARKAGKGQVGQQQHTRCLLLGMGGRGRASSSSSTSSR